MALRKSLVAQSGCGTLADRLASLSRGDSIQFNSNISSYRARDMAIPRDLVRSRAISPDLIGFRMKPTSRLWDRRQRKAPLRARRGVQPLFLISVRNARGWN